MRASSPISLAASLALGLGMVSAAPVWANEEPNIAPAVVETPAPTDQIIITKTTSGSRRQKPQIVSNLHNGTGYNVESSRDLHHSIMGSQGFKFVRSCDKW